MDNDENSNSGSEEMRSQIGIARKGSAMKAAFWCIVLIAATVVLWINGMNSAWHTGGWVGASHIPVPQEAQLAAFRTSIVDACVGVVCLLLAKWRRSVTLAVIGGVALIMAGGTFAASVWFLAMGGIT